MTEGSILGKIVAYAIPIIIGNMLQQLYNVADTLIVGRTLGVVKLAAVGATGGMNFLLMGFVMGMTGGCSVVSSQAFGAGDERALKRSVAAHAAIAASLTVLLTAAFLALTPFMLRAMNTTDELFPLSKAYITIIYSGLAATMLYNFVSSTLRAVGDSRTPLMFLVFSSLLNIALDLAFIVFLGWDIEGAAGATVLSQFISGLLCVIYMRRTAPFLFPDRGCWRGLMPMVKKEIRVGVPMGFQFTIIALGFMVLQSILNGFGAEAVAAYTVGSKVHELIQNPLAAMSIVVATFVGQNLGAAKYDRIRSGVRTSVAFSLAMGAAVGLAAWLLRVPVAHFFLDSPSDDVVSYVGMFMLVDCPGMLTLALLFVYRGAIQGLGDGMTVMAGGVLELVMRVIVAFSLAPSLGYFALCFAPFTAWTSSLFLMVYMFFKHVRRAKALKNVL